MALVDSPTQRSSRLGEVPLRLTVGLGEETIHAGCPVLEAVTKGKTAQGCAVPWICLCGPRTCSWGP